MAVAIINLIVVLVSSGVITEAIKLIEMIVKILLSGVKPYFKDRFNIFDTFIILVSTVEIILQYSMNRY